MKDDTSQNDRLFRQRQQLDLHLAYLLLGGIILLIGLRDAIISLFSYLNPIMIYCDIPWEVCVNWHMQTLRQKIYRGFAFAAAGGSFTVLPYLLKNMRDVQASRRPHQRRGLSLRLTYLIIGGVIMLVGIWHVILFREAYLNGYGSLLTYRREIIRGLILVVVGGSIAVLLFFLLKGINKTYTNDIILQRLWQPLYLGYLVVGVVLLLTGLQHSLKYISKYLRSGCPIPNTCLREIAKGLILVAAGGGLVVFPHFLRRMAQKLPRNSHPRI